MRAYTAQQRAEIREKKRRHRQDPETMDADSEGGKVASLIETLEREQGLAITPQQAAQLRTVAVPPPA